MILLVSTSDEIQLTASGTTDLDIHASYVDLASGTETPGRKNTNITSTTPTAIVASPGSSTSRTTKTIHIRNTHASAVTVTITHTDGTTPVEMVEVALPSGYALHYDEHEGWRTLDSRGRVRTSRHPGLVQSSGTDLSADKLSADDTNNNAGANTAEDIAELVIPIDAAATEVVWFRAVIQYTAAATTTGSRWMISQGVNTSSWYRNEDSLSTTTRTVGDGHWTSDSPAAASASSAATGSNIAIIEGFIYTLSTGGGVENAVLRFASEVSSSAIVAKAGSVVHMHQTV